MGKSEEGGGRGGTARGVTESRNSAVALASIYILSLLSSKLVQRALRKSDSSVDLSRAWEKEISAFITVMFDCRRI